MYEKVIIICGMPRSGTSWVGQIFDSSPDVAFRMEPLFSYRFKNIINVKSSKEEIECFLNSVYLTDDDFILQKENRRKGIYPKFKKSNEASFLAYKTTRHHELLHKYLEAVKNVHIVSIVRHPCAVINSWIRSDNEFEKKGCTLSADWKAGACRKEGVGEYWGFDDWLSVTQDHVSLSHKYSNFNILEYSDLIRGSEGVIYKLFKQLLIPYTKQTAEFLKDCHSSHDDDPYSVFKSASVENKWKSELDSDISHEIIRSAKAANLGQFLK